MELLEGNLEFFGRPTLAAIAGEAEGGAGPDPTGLGTEASS
jgi:hypothetical protein